MVFFFPPYPITFCSVMRWEPLSHSIHPLRPRFCQMLEPTVTHQWRRLPTPGFGALCLVIGWLSSVNGSTAAPTLKRCESGFVSDDLINSLRPLVFLQTLPAWLPLHRTPNAPVVERAPSGKGVHTVVFIDWVPAMPYNSAVEAPPLSDAWGGLRKRFFACVRAVVGWGGVVKWAAACVCSVGSQPCASLSQVSSVLISPGSLVALAERQKKTMRACRHIITKTITRCKHPTPPPGTDPFKHTLLLIETRFCLFKMGLLPSTWPVLSACLCVWKQREKKNVHWNWIRETWEYFTAKTQRVF